MSNPKLAALPNWYGAAKIDGLATDGLLGTPDSLAYRVHIIEKQWNSRVRWRGKLAVQTATAWADDTLAPFQAISGNNAYGTDPNDEALVIGTDDTPIIPARVYYSLHRFLMIDCSSATVYKVRFVYGAGTMAAAITAGQWTETMIMSDPLPAVTPHGVFELVMPRLTCGATQVWCQVWNATDNATLDFLVGMHEYEG